ELEPKNARALGLCGNARARTGKDIERALREMSQSLELDPKDAIVWFDRGFARLQKGDHADAVADFTRSIELDPKVMMAWKNRGTAWMLLRQADRAIADFSHAIEADPKDVMALTNRGVARDGS